MILQIFLFYVLSAMYFIQKLTHDKLHKIYVIIT